MRAVIYAKAALFDSDGKVLLLTRSDTDEQRPGEFDLAGGSIEVGEDIIEGVSREIREEAGLSVAPADLTLVYAATEAYEKISVTRLLFVAKVSDAPVKLSHEHSDFKWVDIQTALTEFTHHFYGKGLQFAYDHGSLPL
jgi:8-oxo-dGTP diphosphatase